MRASIDGDMARRYKLSPQAARYRNWPREVARYRCLDCGVNVIRIGDWYMLSDAIWVDQFGLGWDDNLCVACVEKRLGRRLSLPDFGGFPAAVVEGYPVSKALIARYGFKARFKPRRKYATAPTIKRQRPRP
jgi:hypothetical protein